MLIPPVEKLLFKRIQNNEALIHNQLEEKYSQEHTYAPNMATDTKHNLAVYANQLCSIFSEDSMSHPSNVNALEAVFLACKIAELAGSEFKTPLITQDARIDPGIEPSERAARLQNVVREYQARFPILTEVALPHLQKLEATDENQQSPNIQTLQAITGHAFLGIELHNVRLHEAEMALLSTK